MQSKPVETPWTEHPEVRAALEAATGEPVIQDRDVRFDLRTPCGDCPFLKATPFHEGVCGNIPDHLLAIMEGNFGHTCHKTDHRPSVDGPRKGKEPPPSGVQHCAGAILMLMKSEQGRPAVSLQRPVARALDDGRLTTADFIAMHDRAVADPNVHTLDSFLDFYQAGLQARMKRYNLRERKKALARKLKQRSDRK